MKINKVFFSRCLIVIVLIIGAMGTIKPSIADGATTNVPVTTDKDSSATTEAANKALMATKQASQNSISNVVTQFASPINSVNNTSSVTTINNLISPLTISSSTITGQPNYSGLYLESNVNYVFSSNSNPLDVGNTATVTLKLNKAGIVPKVTRWILKTRSPNTSNAVVRPGDTQSTSGSGDRIVPTDNQTAIVIGSKTLTTPIPDVIGGGFLSLEVDPNDDAPVYIDIPTGGPITSEDWSDHAFDDTLMHFHIKKDIFQRVIDDINARNVPTYEDFSLNSAIFKWEVIDENQGTAIPGSVSSDDLDVKSNKVTYDPSILDYDFTFFKDGHVATNLNVVRAILNVDFTYTYRPILGFPQTKHGNEDIKLGGLWVEPLRDPPATDADLPTLTISNQIQNLTNPDSNVTDGDKKGLEVRNVKNGDRIEYGANFDAESQNGQDALITKGVYTVPIPKGMNIDTSSFKYTSYYNYQNSVDNSEYKPVDSENISIQDDPNDNAKQLLTVSGLNISPEIAGEIGRLVFDGQVTNDNQSDFTFTPSFKGVGGYENYDQTKPLYVEENGQDQLINFDPTKPAGGVTLTPMDIDFGALNSFVTIDTLRHRVNNDSPVLTMQDDRSDTNKSSQTISVQQMGDLSNGTSKFPGELRFYDPTSSNNEFESLISGSIVPIYVSKNGETLSSISWADDKGLLLHINGANTAIPSGKYTTTLDWTISDTI